MTLPDEPVEEPRARTRDLLVGLSKVFQPWFVGVLVVGVVLVVLALGANRPADPSFADDGAAPPGLTFEERRIMIGDRCLRVQVAATAEQQAQGLRNKTSLGIYNGMLFEFEAMGNREFTAVDLEIPLTVAFYDEAGVRVDAVDMQPCPEGSTGCPTYGTTKGPFKTALQVGVGQLPDGALTGPCPA